FSLREQMSTHALGDLVQFLRDGSGQVAIFDATNTTRARRNRIIRTLVNEPDLGMDLNNIIFIESVCTDDKLVSLSVADIKIQSEDYTNVDPDTATQDFM